MSSGEPAPRQLAADKNFRLANSEGYLAVFGNILLAVGKFYVGLVTGSLAITADGWHTLSDTLSSLILLLGVAISRKPADREHPFGYGRAEVIAALAIGFLLAVIGIEFVHLGIDALRGHKSAEYGVLALGTMVFSVLFKEAMAQYAFWTARKTGMESLRADGYHHRSDALSSLVLLMGMILGGHFWFMDGVLSLVVALFILYAAWRVVRNAGNLLLGRRPDTELLQWLERLCAEQMPGNSGLHHVHLHQYGMHNELTFHIRMPGATSLLEAHRMTQELEKRIMAERGITATIHVEPFRNHSQP